MGDVWLKDRRPMPLKPSFTVWKYEIPFKKYGEPVYIIPFGDVHRNAPLCHEGKWLEFLGWASKKPNCYFLGMGDYDDLASTTERIILSNKSLHDSSRQTLEDTYTMLTKKIIKEISFMKGRIIGLMEGNHFGEFIDNTTTTQMMCRELCCKYLGVSAFIKISLRYTAENKQKPQGHYIDIWAHHGKGAARLIGGSLNKVQQMAEAAEADIYLMGHDHKKSIGMMSRLRLSNSRKNVHLTSRKQVFARTGSFLRGYVDGKPSYVAWGAMNPTDLGVIKLELTPKRSGKKVDGVKVDERHIDIHASL